MRRAREKRVGSGVEEGYRNEEREEKEDEE